jgi:hypothetical protein
VKRTNVSVCFALLALFPSNVQCGGDTGLEQPGSASTGPAGAGGQGGSGTTGSGGSGGSSVLPEAGPMHACPTTRPADRSRCPERESCHYPDGVCSCVRLEGVDGGGHEREWNCFDTVLRDAGVCPKDAKEGEPCVIPGISCPGMNAGSSCSCLAADGSLQWRC